MLQPWIVGIFWWGCADPRFFAGHEIIALVENSRSHGQEVNHTLSLGCECMVNSGQV